MGMLGANKQDEPLHAGEVFNLWTYLYGSKGDIVTLQVFINHTGDHDLKIFLEDLLENIYIQEEQQVESILKETGIRLPPAPPDRPNVEVQDIPAGARFNDSEIAVLVQNKLSTGKMLCSYIMGISIKENITGLIEEFHTQKAEYSLKLSTIMKEKGWIVSPPINIK